MLNARLNIGENINGIAKFYYVLNNLKNVLFNTILGGIMKTHQVYFKNRKSAEIGQNRVISKISEQGIQRWHLWKNSLWKNGFQYNFFKDDLCIILTQNLQKDGRL